MRRVQRGLLRHQRGLPARGRAEHEEADLVLGDMDRHVEAKAGASPRQLLGRGACSPLVCGALGRLATGQIRLDEVSRHALDATAFLRPWKRQNV